MRALITGGAGFIGSHIATFLVENGHQVVVLDNLSSGKRDNLAHLGDRVTLSVGDIRDADRVRQVTEGCELVFHQAAVVSVPYSVEHPEETNAVNIDGTFNVLRAAHAQGARRVVLASSAAIYGEDPALPKREDMVPAPVSPYGAQKITGEYFAQVFSHTYGLEAVALRYFNVFGPRQDPSSPYSGVISIFADRLLSGATPIIFGDGEQSRDFIYVDNVVQANWLAATVPAAAGRVYNVGLGQQTSLNTLLSTMAGAVGRQVEAEYRENRAGDIRHSMADMSRIKQELGFDPTVSVEQGLANLVASLG